ncbi:MAG: hypothetical protein UX99_C0003G0047 [Candidatus Amesbacteria bacterium GW2011_GWB1_47_26]|uniref:Uncharacterized protein n=1 Tax=Candidatus Amesbacteria bacterium GW2011_GWC2_45_19 TaxID=1618366 RepID=A0A0G1PCS3_9BACT|nr:MAG: hypothetical protein UX05_C0003G0047 [Candidatus Amesbacteria bacterium GW2011_GWC2_45_19]KKU38667.1 MAG: hypothetical protein UX52_C0002G0047 [Candidatus Amesbacteria bacterium GW2011_GWA1_46_35]KKU68628.1 MAG: hypothetical protein UX93_C0006G0045 [Microgenomates group bacterium GW2011_GWC1_47_20]KKU74987.1 MAG: hypothetical protein UX99_C0003G0047 [Candidatus Amesbacteria bacterium GW2011_GWB1_47_26]
MSSLSEHERNRAFKREFYARQAAEEAARKLKAERANATHGEVREQNEAFAHAMGVTREEFHKTLSTHAALGLEALHLMGQDPKVTTVKEAIRILYEEAGHKANKLVSGLQALGSERKLTKTRRKKRKTKGRIIEMANRRRQEKERQKAADSAFEALVREQK